MNEKLLTDTQYVVLRAMRPALAEFAEFKVGLPYRVVQQGTRLRLLFTSIDEGEYPGFDRQVDTAAACLVLDIEDLAFVFNPPNDNMSGGE